MPPDQMLTRRKRINYRPLNDGSDYEALPEDQVIQTDLPSSPPNKTEIEAFTNISDGEILSSDSTVPSTSNVSKDALYQDNSQPFQQP
ncbi:hypothetical protein BDV12DRAFT_167884 [Aspergillus spectabilis]